jgi:hypothetical protein
MADLIEVRTVGMKADGSKDDVMIVNRDHIVTAQRRTKPETSARGGLEVTVLALSNGEVIEVNENFDLLLSKG